MTIIIFLQLKEVIKIGAVILSAPDRLIVSLGEKAKPNEVLDCNLRIVTGTQHPVV